MKLTKRKGFNFFRSYYDVYNELTTDKDKIDFIDALLDRQFLGVKPTGLTGMAKFAYISQTNSIDSQVKGYEDKTGTKLNPLGQENNPPTVPPTQGGQTPPTVQVEEKGEVKDKPILLESVSSPPIGVDPLYFYVAKGFHKLFSSQKQSKNLKKALVSDWVNTVRLIIENDEIPIIHLIAIKYYFELGIEVVRGVDTFWVKTIFSMSAFRKKDKDGIYQIDRINEQVKTWLQKNPEQESEILRREKNLLEIVAECQN